MTATNFKEKRKARGFTQAALAKEIGVSLTTIQLWEKEISKPSDENQQKIDKVLGR